MQSLFIRALLRRKPVQKAVHRQQQRQIVSHFIGKIYRAKRSRKKNRCQTADSFESILNISKSDGVLRLKGKCFLVRFHLKRGPRIDENKNKNNNNINRNTKKTKVRDLEKQQKQFESSACLFEMASTWMSVTHSIRMHALTSNSIEATLNYVCAMWRTYDIYRHEFTFGSTNNISGFIARELSNTAERCHFIQDNLIAVFFLFPILIDFEFKKKTHYLIVCVCEPKPTQITHRALIVIRHIFE